MRKTTIATFVVFSVFYVAYALSGSATAASTATPGKTPNFSQFKFRLGTWLCHTAKATAPANQSTAVYTMVYGNRWMKVRGESRRAVRDSYVTYDPTLEMWVLVRIDSLGGYGISTSSGWRGNIIVWSSTDLAGRVSRVVTTKLSDTKVSSAYGASVGSMKETFTDECDKQ